MQQDNSNDLGLPDLGQGGNVLNVPSIAVEENAAVGWLDRWLAKTMLRIAGNPPFAFRLWDGETIRPVGVSPRTEVQIADRNALWQLLTNPNLNFGDLFSVGRIEVEGSLLSFLEDLYDAIEYSEKRHPYLWSGVWKDHLPSAGTLTGSRKNIEHHYDLGNDFYRLWLDPDYMQYTCAYFPDPTYNIAQAQVAKMHHVCKKLQLQPGERVAEAGCGWGGLALFMARHYGVRVKSYNISHEQIVYAREQVQRLGLADQVEYVEDDYRNLQGEFDAFVSVGMLEHVGLKQYSDLGRVLDRCLTATGRGLIHSIGRNRPGRMNAWIEKRIFPGAYPPTVREMMTILEPQSFSILDVENLRLHYAKTIEHWLNAYEAEADTVRKMYGESFVRAWRLYLTGSIASFTTGWLQLFQVVFARPHRNDLPWSRAHLYE
jgi:cyclopropane-fatty-acyl-phospholipid synthase